ncbi:DNA cytosine methyltransferase [Azoarcus sp. L1K30]|uniref:DNA cytosine methyltransferase n=1 Tax=Azoarcus sp. L1K30 TaxID=2820277 RepID=UPI001B81C8F8|nr:DNA cytosine methyltransferase [Azoarcus sp. L1K30]MBR0568394.1 DNA cytosine methyltransferase [Azoarcus sp. L1K30]
MKRDAFTAFPDDVREIRHFHLFCGLGGGAKGFNKASPRVGSMVGKFRCIGGIDVDAPAIRDFERLTGTPGTVLDMFDRSQFKDFHGMEPPAGWRECTPMDIRAAAGGEYPHIVFLSAPCKGFSGLLAEGKSKTAKYQALNRLTVRGVWLMLEAFADEPPELIVFENVPRIANRGRHLLDQIGELLRTYGYAVAETTHDCGEIGALAQSRKRFLLVARHMAKVAPFLYEPDKKRLQAVGTVLDRMPLPGDPAGGPMHRVPRLQWKTWVRLAFVEAGSDWRSLNKLAVENGHLRDYLIVPEYHQGYLGVHCWEDSMGTVAGRSTPSNGAFSIADPRFDQSASWNDGQAYGVRRWDEASATVTSKLAPGSGYGSVADPRHLGPAKHCNEFRIVPWSGTAGAVTGAHGSGQCVADPRGADDPALLHGKYKVEAWNEPARTVIAGNANGAFAVADPRPNGIPEQGDHYLTGGHYGVVGWGETSGAVSAAACHDNGRWSVADPRNLTECSTCTESQTAMPAPADKLVAVIRSIDGTWHRPFTTLELAALQSLVDPEEQLELDGLSDSAWRERIGNAVPPDAAEAIAGVMGTTLLLAWSGETFTLSSAPVWVRPVAVALSVAQAGSA